MAAPKLLNLEFGSRRQSRLRLCLPAVVVTRDGTRRATLEDLSIGGACLQGGGPFALDQPALIQWDRFEAVGQVRWVSGDRCGLAFFTACPIATLLESRDLSDHGRPHVGRDLVSRTAAAFRNGRMRL